MLRGGGSAPPPPDLSGSTPGERNFSFCLLLAPALSSDTPSRSLCLIRNTWGHFDWPTFCQVSRSLSQQWPCFCCGRWKCQHSTRGPSLSQGRGAAGDPHSDSHDLFGEYFLLTKNFVVLVEPLRGGGFLGESCVGHMALETAVEKPCLVSWSVPQGRTSEGVPPPQLRVCSWVG